MAKNLIVGRRTEQHLLQESYDSKESQLVILYGRRRVGKSFLINQFFEDNFDFKLVGDYQLDKKGQLANFHYEMKRQSRCSFEMPESWNEAFLQLREYLDSQNNDRRLVVFFDEMPWLDNQKSGFLAAFEYFWNSYGASKNNLMFIVCGSATSWLVENIDHNKGGLFNRQNLRIFLEPFTLGETEEYLIKRKSISWNRNDIAECYMILGGIPYYLNLLQRTMSLSQNVDNLFFRKRAVLWDEFDHLYKTLFSNSENHIKVIEAICTKRIGLTRSEILCETKLSANTAFSRILRSLVDSGFVREYTFFGSKKRGKLYQIADFYTAFYLKFVKENYGKDEEFWSHLIGSSKRTAWEGLTFEQLCKDHIRQIKAKLGIAGVTAPVSAWYHKCDEDHDGAQIDMLMDRKDRTITICEMKFSDNPFVIDKKYDEELRNKIGVFKAVTGTTKAIQLVMVTTYGVKENKYSNILQNQITIDDLFV